MLCHDCGQRVATVILTEVREGRKETLHLCQHCVEARGIPSPALNDPVQVDQVFRDLLSRLGEEEGIFDGSHPRDADTCRNCDWTFGRFRQTGLLGCPHCYRAFEEPLNDLLKKLHGSAEHLGKACAHGPDLTRELDLDQLQQDLATAIEREDFELAADLRDRIQHLREGGETS